MSKGISERRHHKERLKKKRKNDTVYYEEHPINKHVITPKVCSCIVCCKSQRKYFGNSKQAKTIRELKQEEKDNELR